MVRVCHLSVCGAREFDSLMQQQGREDERMRPVILALLAGNLFRRVTLPNIKWALI